MPYDITTSRMSPGPREAWPAIRRGFGCTCPACGKGRMFGRYLKVNPVCEACGEEMFHEEAHDFPPYITISIVAHVVLLGVVLAEQHGNWPMWLHMAIWPVLTIILALALMQPVKGAVVGYQWARRMHGFGGDDEVILGKGEPQARSRDRTM
ncbi:MAG: DUF983 domain-containing protein [Beijerinckiaceae bacterium]|jgi:uncharacterized protein (DUF983 family)|nr:DUF983 domain-containing protein [Beijerinckiaceae bacterium]